MSDDMNRTGFIQDQQPPYMLGYTVKAASRGRKSYWSKVGIACAHKDGQGYNVQMDALPVDGKLVLRAVSDEHEDQGEMFAPVPDGTG